MHVHQVWCMGEATLIGIEDFVPFHFPFGLWTLVHGVNNLNWLKTFMQVEFDVVYMSTKFVG